MGRYRTINVHLDRGYRNDLNANFEQIGIDITSLEAGIDSIVGGGFIESLEMAREGANAAATVANSEAQFAATQGSYAKTQGDYAKAQGDQAKLKGAYADEKAILADQAAGRANAEATGLEALKIAVVDATQAANTSASHAQTAGDFAQTQGDHAKYWGDQAQAIVTDKGTVISVNGQQGAVELSAEDVGAVPASAKGQPNGVAGLNAEGKVVDALGNEVEGKVTSVNGQLGEVVLSAADVGAETPSGVQVTVDNAITPINTQLTNHESRLNLLETDTGQVVTNVSGLYRETAWLKLKQEAADRIDGGVTFADDFNGNRFGFTLNEEESVNVKIRDGKMLMIEDVKTKQSVVDQVVVAQPYSTAGNGGRKLVRLSNGWLIAAITKTVASYETYFLVSKDNGKTWTQICWVNGTAASEISISSSGTVVYVLKNIGSSIGFSYFDALTVEDVNIFSGRVVNVDSSQSSFSGNSLAIDPTNGHLHAAWASKNSSLPSVWNIRYSKSMDGGTTWSVVEQVSIRNTASLDVDNPSIVVRNGEPLIIVRNNTAITVLKKEGLTTGTGAFNWTYSQVFTGGTYGQFSPSAVVDKYGVIHVAWIGKDVSDSNDSLRYSKSSDGGVIWMTPKKLTSGTRYFPPSITTDKDGSLFIVSRKTAINGKYNIFLLKGIEGTPSEIQISNHSTFHSYNPTTLYDPTFQLKFNDLPPTIYDTDQSVFFSGHWTEVVEEQRVSATAVYDVPSTDYVGAFVKKIGVINANAFLNDVPMDSLLVDDEYQFETPDMLPIPVSAKLRIELSRTSVDGGENDALIRILGGRA